VFVAVVSAPAAFAADPSAAPAAAAAQSASNLNLPTVSIKNNSGRTRAEVRAEAVEFVKNYQTAFAVQLEQYKN
jgi:hypothetical protein